MIKEEVLEAASEEDAEKEEEEEDERRKGERRETTQYLEAEAIDRRDLGVSCLLGS